MAAMAEKRCPYSKPGRGQEMPKRQKRDFKGVADGAARALIADRRGGGEFHHGGDGTAS